MHALPTTQWFFVYLRHCAQHTSYVMTSQLQNPPSADTKFDRTALRRVTAIRGGLETVATREHMRNHKTPASRTRAQA